MTATRHDVVILGAGMAGLTLARQLKLADPALDIAVLEHRRFPAPDAAFKVGESTVEIAAHYLSEGLGLGDHLREAQLPKFGLRLFLRGETAITDDLARYDEIGASRVLPIPTYQIDRGRFENALADRCLAQGVQVLDGVTVRDLDLGQQDHTVRTSAGTVRCRYLVDASGRRGLLRQRLGLERDVRHGNHAVWFRVSGQVDIDGMSRDGRWQARCHGTPRRLSTNHFTGPGYWVWVIPLSSDATSIGVVFDPKWVAPDTFSKHDGFMRWLRDEHPLLAAALDGREVMDYHRMQRYAAGCKQTFSPDGWMITGDAGNFADPFYSPGGDFIALGNTFVTQLVTSGAEPRMCERFQTDFNAFFVSTLGLYKGVYGGFGHRDLMVAKTIWDYAYYWGVLSKLFFSGRMVDIEFMKAMQGDLQLAFGMNSNLQRAFRKVASRGQRVGGEGRFYDQHDIGFFHEWKEDLLSGDAASDATRLRANVAALAEVRDEVSRWLAAAERGEPSPPLATFSRALSAA